MDCQTYAKKIEKKLSERLTNLFVVTLFIAPPLVCHSVHMGAGRDVKAGNKTGFRGKSASKPREMALFFDKEKWRGREKRRNLQEKKVLLLCLCLAQFSDKNLPKWSTLAALVFFLYEVSVVRRTSSLPRWA